jgi:hypothetical protein
MIIGFLIFILFPIWVVYYASRRDRSGLATLTLLSMFVGLGPLVGLLTLLRIAGKV